MTIDRPERITDAERSTVDGPTLTEELGIDAEEIAWRKEFTQFDESDAERMVDLSGALDPIAEDLVDRFYRRSRPSASGLDPEGEGRKLR